MGHFLNVVPGPFSSVSYTEEQLSAILKENNLDGEKLNKVGFYSRYGGKIVGLIIIALIIWGFIPSKKKKTEPGRSIKQT